MKNILLLSLVLFATTSFASDKRVYRLNIKHADPQLIYMLLKGQTNFATEPEMSSVPRGNGGFGNSGLGGGRQRG